MNDWAGKLNSASTAPREDLRRFAEEMTAARDRKSGVIGQKIEYLHIGIIFTSVGLRVLLELEEGRSDDGGFCHWKLALSTYPSGGVGASFFM